MASSKDRKKLGIAAGVAFVALTAMEFVFNSVILKGVYQRPQYVHLWNPQPVMGGRMSAMFLAYAIFAILFTKIYTHGYEEGKPVLGQGSRYGFLVGVMVFSFWCLVDYMVYPVSLKLTGAWIAGGVVQTTILGALVSLIYQPRPGQE